MVIVMANKELIYKDNRIIEASYKLSLIEQRLVLIAISKINAVEILSENKVFRITSSEYSSAFGMTQDSAMREMRTAVVRLYDASIKVIDKDKKYSDIKGGHRWITGHQYTDTGGFVELRFSPEIAPYLYKLKGNFTKYQIINITKMSSIYAIRIYEMLMQWKTKKTLFITVDQLRDRLMLDSDSYKAFANIKQKIIDKAVEEINQHSDITTSYELVKTGKKVTSIRFGYEFKSQALDRESVKQEALEHIENMKRLLK